MTDYTTFTEDQAVLLRVAIGQQLTEKLNLKVDKKTGYVQTTEGKKTMQGIGSIVIGMVETEAKRIAEYTKQP